MSIKKALTLKYDKKDKKLDITGYERDSLAKEVLRTADTLHKKVDDNKSFVNKITEINEDQNMDETSVNILTETLCFLYEIETDLS